MIEPDELRLSIVWRGHAPALRPYHLQELANIPLTVVVTFDLSLRTYPGWRTFMPAVGSLLLVGALGATAMVRPPALAILFRVARTVTA